MGRRDAEEGTTKNDGVVGLRCVVRIDLEDSQVMKRQEGARQGDRPSRSYRRASAGATHPQAIELLVRSAGVLNCGELKLWQGPQRRNKA